jgi:hypothetical protein
MGIGSGRHTGIYDHNAEDDDAEDDEGYDAAALAAAERRHSCW